MSDQSAPPAAAPRLPKPGDVTLLKGILRPWLASGVHQPHDAATGIYIKVADVSCASPEDLPDRFRATVSLNGDCVWYFLSPLSPHAKLHGGKHKVRTTSDGTTWWRDEGADKQILDPYDGNRLIGHRKMLSLMLKNNAGGPDVRVGWIMHELYLHHHQDGGTGRIDDSAVLAKIYPSKLKRRRQDKNAGGGAAAAPSKTQKPEGPLLLPATRASLPAAEHDNPEYKATPKSQSQEGLPLPLLPEAASTFKNPEKPEAAAAASTFKNPEKPEAAAAASTFNNPEKPEAAAASTFKNPEKPEAAAAASTFNNPEKPEAASASTFNNPEKPEAAASPVKKPEKLEAAAATHKEPENPEAAAWIAKNTNQDASPACKKLKGVAGAPAVAGHLLCPKCGFHVGALQLTSTAELSG